MTSCVKWEVCSRTMFPSAPNIIISVCYVMVVTYLVTLLMIKLTSIVMDNQNLDKVHVDY